MIAVLKYVVVLVCFRTVTAIGKCNTVCDSCGSEIVSCSDVGLTSVPTDIPETVTSLYA